LVNDLQQSEIVTKGAEGLIASARAVIAKVQALIRDNELKVENEKKRIEKLGAAKSQVQLELDVHTLRLEALWHNLLRRRGPRL